jgi:hypothetical protein
VSLGEQHGGSVLLIVFHACLWSGVLLAAGGVGCLPFREWIAARWCAKRAGSITLVGRVVGHFDSMMAFRGAATSDQARELTDRIELVTRWEWVTAGTLLLALAVGIAAWIVPKLVEPSPDAKP